MELFFETYNCYFQIMKDLLTRNKGLTTEELQNGIAQQGFGESAFYLLPKLSSGEWNLLRKEGELYYSVLSEDFYVPLTHLQKGYLKALLSDSRLRLFLSDEELTHINELLEEVAPLWEPDDFYYYDQFQNGDDYDSPLYRKHFQEILHAISKKTLLDIEYQAKSGARVHHRYLPCRLEYSIKNDRFRLLCLKSTKNHFSFEIMNLERIQNLMELNETVTKDIDLDAMIHSTYYKEPVRLLIKNQRNALERAMLHFANYQKNTTKIDNDTYECLIYYNEQMETELLIEVLSFGPMIKVLGNEKFLNSLKFRLKKQLKLTTKEFPS